MKKHHIIISGMHRSGTSFLARSLNLSGVNLGPSRDFFDSELKPKFGNPKGHWENKKIIQLNEEIFSENNASWLEPVSTLTKLPTNFNGKITNILNSFYSENAIYYGLKDPRFCLTLDHWIKYLENFTIIGIFRHPLKVAESLKQRDAFDYKKSLKIWEIYNTGLISALQTHGGFLINFDWDKEKLLEQIQVIISKLDLPKVDLSNWFSESFKFSDKSYDQSYSLPETTKNIFTKLKNISEKNHSVNISIPKLSSEQYQLIFSDILNRSNNFYQEILADFKKNQNKEKQKNSKILDEAPIGTILSIFYERKDLQEKFPEVNYGDFSGITYWARQILNSETEGEKLTKERLSKYAQWFDDYWSTFLPNMKREQNKRLAKEIDSLTFDISQYKKEIDLLKSSLGFKVTRGIGSQIDKIKSKKKALKDLESTAKASRKIIEDEGFGSFISQASNRVKRGELLLESPIDLTKPRTSKPQLTKFQKTNQTDSSIAKQYTASVIIPTNSTATDLKFLIEKLNKQLGFKQLQIILINSGASNLQSLASQNLVTLEIKQSEFNHSKVRNLGLKESKGDYVFFMSDDVIPSSNRLLFDMCETFSNHKKIAAVTARQIPKSDSDLMGIFSIHEYYRILDLAEDRIISSEEFEDLDFVQKRMTAQIDDVCSCYSKEILSKYQFGKVDYAEDLDLGTRLVSDGYKIAQLFTKAVIHSHSRPASSYLTRQFVESRTLNSVLQNNEFDFKKQGISTMTDLKNHIFSLYYSLNKTLENLKQEKIHDIEKTFEFIRKYIKENFSASDNTKISNSSLDEIFKQFSSEIIIPKNNILLGDYEHSLLKLKNFLKSSYPNLSGIEDEFVDTLYKLFAVLVGDRLGTFVSYLEKNKSDNKELHQIVSVISSDV